MPRELTLTFPPAPEAPSLEDEAGLKRRAARELGLEPGRIAAVRATRVSFDARRRERVWRVRCEVFERGEEPPAEPEGPPTYREAAPDAPRVAIVGSGPAGLFCALDLLAAGLSVHVFERGRDVRTRRRSIRALYRGEPADPDCNYCFGEGGAGTYSDGKLYTRSGRKKDVRGVLETLVAHGAPREILISWRPHVGSNRLPEVVTALRETLLRSGGRISFGHRVERIETREIDGRREVAGLSVRNLETQTTEVHAADAVVLAAGHSALDVLTMARAAGAALDPKGFAMGVRIEHAQGWLDQRQYGGLRDTNDLPAAFYELAREEEGRGVYSFCMCPGGFVVPATTAPDRVVVNGMSLSRRDSPFANAGIVVALEPEDWCGERAVEWGWPALLERAQALSTNEALRAACPDDPAHDPLFGVRLQLALETVAAHLGGGANRAPSQRADLFVEGTSQPGPALPTSFRPGVTPVDMTELLPPGLLRRLRAGVATFDGKLPGFASEAGQVLGVESRTSSPVRVVRDPETLASPQVDGLFPAGEGAGYAGGIVSAALDGRRVAAAMVRTATRRTG